MFGHQRFRLTGLVIHAAGWLLFLLLPLLFLNNSLAGSGLAKVLASPFYWLFCGTYLVLFYINSGWLVPELFLKRRYAMYWGVIALLFCAVYYLQPFEKLLEHNPASIPQPERMFGPLPHEGLRMQEPEPKLLDYSGDTDLVSLFLFVLITALSFASRAIQQWSRTERLVMRTEAERVRAELSFLKAQINPHFLFNTLNNIYALSVSNSPSTSESIMKLSGIMRYVTDDVSADLVPLGNELDCLRDYIDLQRLRTGSKTRIDLQITGSILDQQVPPLIFISFVENTFKYGVSKKEESVIGIYIDADEDEIRFRCENRMFTQAMSERKGVGVENTRRRLDHLYPGKYRLQIGPQGDRFLVSLVIPSTVKSWSHAAKVYSN